MSTTITTTRALRKLLKPILALASIVALVGAVLYLSADEQAEAQWLQAEA